MSRRQAVFPTRMALTSFKLKQVGAQKGYELLKKKSDALTARLRGLLKEIKNTKEEVGKQLSGATFSISEAVWAAGDFRKRVTEAPPRDRALVRVRVRTDNVAGVKLPVFTLVRSTGSDTEMEMLGLAGGGRQIATARDKFMKLLEGLVRLGSLQTSFRTLDDAIKLTNRRVNALDNVVIPSIVDTIAYVTSELDEIEKEEFFRLKKVLKVKDKARIAAEEEERAEAAAAAAGHEEEKKEDAAAGHGVAAASAAMAAAHTPVRPAGPTPAAARPTPHVTPAPAAVPAATPVHATPVATPSRATPAAAMAVPTPAAAVAVATPAPVVVATPVAALPVSPAPSPSPAHAAPATTAAHSTPLPAYALDPFDALEASAPAAASPAPAAAVSDPYQATFGTVTHAPAVDDPFDDSFAAYTATGPAATTPAPAPAAAAFDAFDDADIVV